MFEVNAVLLKRKKCDYESCLMTETNAYVTLPYA